MEEVRAGRWLLESLGLRERRGLDDRRDVERVDRLAEQRCGDTLETGHAAPLHEHGVTAGE